MIDLLEGLNPQQKEVVKTTEGPILVLAGAGSGKTKSIIHRCAYLLKKKKVAPWNLLVVTFTNKAANELKERLQSTFNINPRNLWVGTFHSICVRILRTESEHINYSSNFTIYDSEDSHKLIKKIIKDLQIDTKKISASRIKNVISRCKNSLITLKDFYEFYPEDAYTKVLYTVFSEYQSRLLEYNAMDFDDLLLQVALLFDSNEDVRKKYEDLFSYVMIDEYQDTNYAQFKIVNDLCKNHKNLCVVGDDDQAIYSWRGATIKNILNFEKDYPETKVIKLERNYRSTDKILAAANSLIHKNEERHTKELWTEETSEFYPILKEMESDREEAEDIAKQIRIMQFDGIDYDKIAILYRTNSQSRLFETVFSFEKIPYQIIGGHKFFERKEIKDIVAYLRVIINPVDENSLLRIINYPTRGIGKTSILRLIDHKIEKDLSLFEVIKNVDELETISRSTKSKIRHFSKMIESYHERINENAADVIVDLVHEMGILEKLENSSDPQDISKAENIKQLIAMVSEYCETEYEYTGEIVGVSQFLTSVSLQSDADTIDDNESKVKLMTIHNAKGLEFHTVFIVGLEDGILPHSMSIEEEKVEEERRLLYVGMTRAKRKLFLSYAKYRRIFNLNERQMPSRFIADINPKLISSDTKIFYQSKESEYVKPKKAKTPKNIILESEKHYKIGQKVTHNTFGEGTIINVDGKGLDAKLTISFTSGALKKIIGTFIKVID